MQDFFFRPSAGKEERHTAEAHHADGVGAKRDRHEFLQAAHFSNVLFVVTSVNHRAGTEKEERLEKTVREQMRNAGSDAAHAERNHHQSQLRNG